MPASIHKLDPAHASKWTAVVLAGERPGGDPLAEALGVPAKALIEIEGQTMLARVLSALLGAAGIGRVLVLSQKIEAIAKGEPSGLLNNPRVTLMNSGNGIAGSLRPILGTVDAPWPVLVTTADNALLTTQRVERFLSGTSGCDIGVGVSERSIVESTFPQTRRTWLKFRDGQYSGANLFAFKNDQSLPAIDHWRAVEQDRKKGIKLIASFGPSLLLTFLLRRVGFEQGLRLAGGKMGLFAKPIMLDAEAPIDVDKLEDLRLVRQILAQRGSHDARGNDPIVKDQIAASR
ncbi:nucleotidyltransferase family protein [Erythrobacter sp. SCSIO 43205]|uniref:nucleotidyltransferase family protein n=1 Tax=Erythrobacter sp. SCSIO 43205 TaxID=2779361 RepID=UPI001CA9A6B7|nr:NTP transferase domain-containing protein [Erythrobacter sp. SCSIO 43205]UAB77725.1 nucleotidyltransferase family protein [Erythrobacter sp. SCSIO 43205]